MAQWLDHWNFTFAQLRTPNTRVRVRDKAYFNITISEGGYIRKLVSYFSDKLLIAQKDLSSFLPLSSSIGSSNVSFTRTNFREGKRLCVS